MTKRKKQRYETVHDENLLAAKLQGCPLPGKIDTKKHTKVE